MINEDDTKGIVSLIVTKLVDSGFRVSKENNALVKLGQSSFVVQVFDVKNYDNIKAFCENIKLKTQNFGDNEFAHHCAYEMIFLCNHNVIEEKNDVYNELRDLNTSIKESGMVCDVILFDKEEFDFSKIEGGKPLSHDVSFCLKEIEKEAKHPLTEDKIHKQTEKQQIAKGTRRNFGLSNMKVLIVIIAINVMIFLCELVLAFRGQDDFILEKGIQDNSAVLSGEYWRLFTSMFLHADIGHLAGNMLSIIYIGRVVSKFYTKKELVLSYVVSGLFGNILSLFFVNGLSLGASGAVMGLGGLMIFKMFFSTDKRYVRNTGNYVSLALIVVYNLFYGVFATYSNINNFAHFGGFLMGFLIAYIIERKLVRKSEKNLADK